MIYFKVDFIQGKTDAADYGQIKYSLVDCDAERLIISLSVSSDKLQSVSNYSREPKRLVFECFSDTWIEENILSGNNEHERYISHYEVKVYRDNALFFSGIIDTSQLSFDVSSNLLKLTCYDKIKLLSVFSDLTHYYGILAGYQPGWILAYFAQDIQQTIPISVPYGTPLSRPALNIPSSNPISIAHVDYADMMELPAEGGWVAEMHSSGWPGPHYGYILDANSAVVTFIFALRVVWDASPAIPPYRGIFRARIYRYYNGICPVVAEYEEDTGWVERLSVITEKNDEFEQFFPDNGVPYASILNLPSTMQFDERRYGVSHYNNYWLEATSHGLLIPSKIQVGDAYIEYEGDTIYTENLKALQAMLMLYNATIVCDIIGTMVLKSKECSTGSMIEIDDHDVVGMVMKRGDGQMPDMATLDVLAGDTSYLGELLKDYLVSYHNSRWSCELVIDNVEKYGLNLQDRIVLRGKEYVLTEIERDYVKDECKVKGWQL